MANIPAEKLRKRAMMCLECGVCNQARKKQKGLAYWFVRVVEGKFCPMCKALEQITGQPAHKPLTQEQIEKIKNYGKDQQ